MFGNDSIESVGIFERKLYLNPIEMTDSNGSLVFR